MLGTKSKYYTKRSLSKIVREKNFNVKLLFSLFVSILFTRLFKLNEIIKTSAAGNISDFSSRCYFFCVKCLLFIDIAVFKCIILYISSSIVNILLILILINI